MTLVFAFLAILAGPLASRGQTILDPAAGAASNHPIPLHHKYRYFLLYQMKLDQKADTLDRQGRTEDAASVRNHLQKDLHFTDEQIAVLRQAGLQLKDNLDGIRLKAAPILAEDRKWLRTNGRSAGPPPGADQIHSLQKQQETIMKDAVDHLNKQLGPEPAARLQSYVDTHIAGHTTHFSQRKPTIGTPFHREAQQ
jgi:uncharacterized protein YdcH (DUF465 family)